MKKLQQKVKDFVKKYQLENKPEIDALDLASEVGEVAKEILEMSDYGRKKPKYRKELKDEIGDAFYSLIKLANHYEIDLEESLELALKKYKIRLRKKPKPNSNK